MIKHVLAGCSLLVLLSASLPAQAQTPTKSPAQTPTSTPAPTAQPPAASQAKVSQDELKKFAVAVKQLLSITQSADTQMSQIVQKQGLTEARFNEIYRAKQDPAAKPTTQITAQEEQKYNQTLTQLVNIQKDAQAKMDKAVQDQGMGMERFNQIFAAVRSNPQLKQEVQKMIQAN